MSRSFSEFQSPLTFIDTTFTREKGYRHPALDRQTYIESGGAARNARVRSSKPAKKWPLFESDGSPVEPVHSRPFQPKTMIMAYGDDRGLADAPQHGRTLGRVMREDHRNYIQTLNQHEDRSVTNVRARRDIAALHARTSHRPRRFRLCTTNPEGRYVH